MSQRINVITQYDDDDDDTGIPSSNTAVRVEETPPSHSAWVTRPRSVPSSAVTPRSLVQLSIFNERVLSSLVPKRAVEVSGYYKSDGSYVDGYTKYIRIRQAPRARNTRRVSVSCRRIAADVSPEERESRRLAAKLHFDDLIAYHERNYPRKQG